MFCRTADNDHVLYNSFTKYEDKKTLIAYGSNKDKDLCISGPTDLPPLALDGIS